MGSLASALRVGNVLTLRITGSRQAMQAQRQRGDAGKTQGPRANPNVLAPANHRAEPRVRPATKSANAWCLVIRPSMGAGRDRLAQRQEIDENENRADTEHHQHGCICEHAEDIGRPPRQAAAIRCRKPQNPQYQRRTGTPGAQPPDVHWHWLKTVPTAEAQHSSKARRRRLGKTKFREWRTGSAPPWLLDCTFAKMPTHEAHRHQKLVAAPRNPSPRAWPDQNAVCNLAGAFPLTGHNRAEWTPISATTTPHPQAAQLGATRQF